jgi:hypothetical protein
MFLLEQILGGQLLPRHDRSWGRRGIQVCLATVDVSHGWDSLGLP